MDDIFPSQGPKTTIFSESDLTFMKSAADDSFLKIVTLNLELREINPYTNLIELIESLIEHLDTIPIEKIPQEDAEVFQQVLDDFTKACKHYLGWAKGRETEFIKLDQVEIISNTILIDDRYDMTELMRSYGVLSLANDPEWKIDLWSLQNKFNFTATMNCLEDLSLYRAVIGHLSASVQAIFENKDGMFPAVVNLLYKTYVGKIGGLSPDALISLPGLSEIKQQLEVEMLKYIGIKVSLAEPRKPRKSRKNNLDALNVKFCKEAIILLYHVEYDLKVLGDKSSDEDLNKLVGLFGSARKGFYDRSDAIQARLATKYTAGKQAAPTTPERPAKPGQSPS